jgi:hypothetical protein
LHGFNSDVALVGIELPPTMDASPRRPSGRAAWLSAGTALVRAAAAHLQIDPGELAVGARPWRHPDGRLLGEIFLYDTLPNGAGYAEEFAKELAPILDRAIELCQGCPEGCETACYHCLLDYGNQRNHALLDRHLALDLLRFVQAGTTPQLAATRARRSLERLAHFAATEAQFKLDTSVDGVAVPALLTFHRDRRISIWPTHALVTPPRDVTEIAIDTGTIPVIVRDFDLSRRPFWVWNQILSGSQVLDA